MKLDDRSIMSTDSRIFNTDSYERPERESIVAITKYEHQQLHGGDAIQRGDIGCFTSVLSSMPYKF